MGYVETHVHGKIIQGLQEGTKGGIIPQETKSEAGHGGSRKTTS